MIIAKINYMKKYFKYILVLLFFISFYSQAVNLNTLNKELNSIDRELIEAIDKSRDYNSGLIKNLIESRIEILKINSALIKQRIQAIESGAKIKVSIDAVKPNILKATEIESEILSLMSEIKKKEMELSKYDKGLLRVLILSNIASLENSISILRLELIKAKYGITWIPKINIPGEASQNNINKDISNIKSILNEDTVDNSLNIIKPILKRKRFESEDFQEHIWFDILWKPINLKRDTRAVKGVLIFTDIFGEERYRIGWTITDTIDDELGLYEPGVGFKYSQFNDKHNWVRNTEFKDMMFKFRVDDIIYQNIERSLKEEIQVDEDKDRVLVQEDILNELKVNYLNQIASRVKDKWRYSRAEDNWKCDVYVLQNKDGVVESVNVSSCNTGNSSKAKSFRDSIERAVYKASPLPLPPDNLVFDYEIVFRFSVN